jgi:rubrerythrin
MLKEALYEAVMQDAERYEDLARRAALSQDDELAEFFQEIRDENRRRAERAERLLAGRLAE